jgi:uncharacterized C2H2 Zn-finger protein
MIIDKVEEGDKFPHCPQCAAVLYHESDELSYLQQAKKKKQDNCNHEYDLSDGHLKSVCVKCGFDLHSFQVPAAQLMRCPKCGNLYHVER